MSHAHHTQVAPLCRACRQGHLQPATFEEVFHPKGEQVRVQLLTSRCDHCGAQTTLGSQHDENLRRLAARKAHYGQLLMGEEILALRKRYGLTQQAAARIFGKGKIAFSRYENETSYPDDSTTLLLQLAIAHPEVLKELADKAGEEIPLWTERCEDRRKSMHVIHVPRQLVALGDSGWRKVTVFSQPTLPALHQLAQFPEQEMAA